MADAKDQSRSLGALFAKREDPYREVDRVGVRKWTAGLLVVQTVLLVALSPLTPPDVRFGAIGWVVLGAIVAGELAAAWILYRHGSRVSENVLLAIDYLAVAALSVLIWLSRDMEA